MPEEKKVVLYLAGWQKRMLRDYVKASSRMTRVEFIPKIPKKEWVMYRQPVLDAIKQGAWNLYLTDEQILHVTETLGLDVKISALSITPEAIASGMITFR